MPYSARQLLEAERWEAIEADINPAKKDELSEKLWALARGVSKTQVPAVDDTFYSYPEEDVEED